MSPATPIDPAAGRQARVPPESSGQRLDVFLAGWLGASRAQVRRLLARGAISVDGRTRAEGDKGTPVAVGQQVEVERYRRPEDERILPEPATADWALPELERGDGWRIVDKPAGRAVHPLGPDETGTVLNAVARDAPEVQGVGEGGLRSGVVHRLDVETSGALWVATEERAWQHLRAAFREHRVAKHYRALVVGVPDPALAARHERAIWVARHRPARVRVAPIETLGSRRDARRAVLEIESITPLGEAGASAELRVRLETGFLHQIRATLAALGHPVLGDPAYGGGDPDVPRPMLHAERLAFEQTDVQAPLPADFVSVRRARGGE